MMTYDAFFEAVTGHPPYPYQRALGEGALPQRLDVPTGLGKTAAVTVAWLYRRLTRPETTARRLVWCLPMRALVEQTHAAATSWLHAAAELFADAARPRPQAHLIMGGEQQLGWVTSPESPHIIIGTQDMLLSRALMRGWGTSRFAWPIHFGLLHTDALWIFDETQLMGVAVETSAQLQGLRDKLGADPATASLWMSATLGDEQLDTIDHRRPDTGWRTLTLGDADLDHPRVRQRLGAAKALHRADLQVPRSTANASVQAYAAQVAATLIDRHVPGTLSLAIVNRVERAQKIYEALIEAGRDPATTGLVHSRYRPADRAAREALLHADGDRVVVATQAVEAGVDVSARTMLTELAPWPSLVQRFGRCNRRGEFDAAEIIWVDVEHTKDTDASLLPYTAHALGEARELLGALEDVGPASLAEVDYQQPAPIRPVLRRKDLLELFDTTPDLAGQDLDVSRYIRDGDDTDVQVFWRDWQGEAPTEAVPGPDRAELCRVSVASMAKLLSKKTVAYEWDALEGLWRPTQRPRPGATLMLHVDRGGYDDALGFTGNKKHTPRPLDARPTADASEAMRSDRWTDTGAWMELTRHLDDVVAEIDAISAALDLDARWGAALRAAAAWHDLGKAHPVFQARLVEPALAADDLDDPPGPGPWAKSNHRRGRSSRPHFRHELASALAFRQHARDHEQRDLIAYLIAAHHGKVRLSIRSLPGELEPDASAAAHRFARGVWHGDSLPAVHIPGAGLVGPHILDLRPMEMGGDSWLNATLALRDHPEIGPFRLAWLEALLRLADQRASARPHADHPRAQEPS